MTRWLVRVGAVLLTTAVAAGLATLSAWPLRLGAPDHALLRLDWRLRGDEAGDCLRPRPEDLEKLPVHMRNPDACLGALPPYRLRLWVDGAVVLDEQVRGGGVREDRPLTVYRDVRVAPGPRRLRAEFVRDAPVLAPADGTPRPATVLRVETDVRLEAGRVLLVVRRQDTGELVVRVPVP